MNNSSSNAPTTAFKRLLESSELEFLCSAHNGISARIAEEAGFRALWGGGLCISAQYGVRDSNEASWTQVLEMLEFMADATTLPILVDGDTGFGNFNNFRRLVRKLEQRSLAGVCIEDKVYPKTNSFIDGSKQRLADIDEFCGRIKAGCDTRRDQDFCIIARTEAFIAGWGLNEALQRAAAYHEAGADAILIHSALDHPTEVLAFKAAWGSRCPVVIVPTTYWRTPTEVFRQAGFSLAIWANHLLRAGITAMRECARALAHGQSSSVVEDRIASLKEVFRLQGAPELKEAEKRYLPVRAAEPRVILVPAARAAGADGAPAPPPDQADGQAVLTRIVAAYNASGLKRITVVGGSPDASSRSLGVEYVETSNGSAGGELAALRAALEADGGAPRDLYIGISDVIFERTLTDALAAADADFSIAVEVDWRDAAHERRALGYVTCSERQSRRAHRRRVTLVAAGEAWDAAATSGEWTGLLRVSARAVPRLRRQVAALMADPARRAARLHELLSSLVESGEEIRVLYTLGHWLDTSSDEEPPQPIDHPDEPIPLHDRRRADAAAPATAPGVSVLSCSRSS